MIKAKDGEVTFRGIRSDIMAEAVTILHTLKKVVSEEEYKTVIRLADKSEEQVKQVKDETDRMREKAEKMREELKKLLGL